MEDKMYLKVHSSYRGVVALCDAEILGKLFEEGKKQLHVRENFYKGELKNAGEVVEILKRQQIEDATFNIVGEKSVKLALEAGIIGEGNIGKVQGVPFALVLL